MPLDGVVLGVDVGGTGVKALLTDLRGAGSIAEYRVPTPQDDPDATQLAELVADLAVRASDTLRAAGTRATLVGIGVVVPGVVDEAAGTAVLAVNLGWRNVPIRDHVLDAVRRRGLTADVTFGHDVRAGAVAETRARDRRSRTSDLQRLQRGSVAFVPVGTGLASALVVDGVVVHGGGWAGEIGQVRIPSGKHAGVRVEEIASAGAVARRTGAPTARDAVELVRAGDAHAVEVWQDCIDVLAAGLTWTTAVAGCHTVILGGGLAEAGSILLDPLRSAVRGQLAGLRAPDIVRARHGDASGAIGAALLAHDTVVAATHEGQRRP